MGDVAIDPVAWAAAAVVPSGQWQKWCAEEGERKNAAQLAAWEAKRDRDSWASKCGEATERALRAERERDALVVRLAERDASLRRATGR